jgi:hypothetical protein
MSTQRNVLCGLTPRYPDHYRQPKTGDETYLAAVTLDDASGNETGFDIQVTANKAAGDDTALKVNQTDTVSGGTSKLIDLQSDATSVFTVDNAGALTTSGALQATSAVVFEDFHGTWTATETLNADMWSTNAGSGTANAAATTVAASLNGEVTITSSSANASSAADASNITGINLGYKANQGGLAMEARLHIDDIAEGYIFVGFTDVIGTTVERPIFLTTTAIDSDATNACGVCFDTGGTTEQWFHGGVKAGTDTAPAYSGTAPVNDTYVTVRVEVSENGAVQGFINGTAIGDRVAAATTITTAMTPAIVVSNSTANAIVMTLDYIWVKQDR